MMSGEQPIEVPFGHQLSKPAVSEFTGCHLGGIITALFESLHIKFFGKKWDLVIDAIVPDEFFIFIGRCSSELKIAVGGRKIHSRFSQQFRKSHTVHTSAQRQQ